MFNHMVEHRAEHLDAVFHALADPTRRAMLHSLTLAERSIGELANPFRMSFAAASKHVKALEQAGLVRRRIEGRTHMCQLEPKRLAEAHDWLSFYQRFWTMRLDDLERELRKPEKPTRRSKR
jgi:DNA-binding transcriptional ArsR family regulator